MQGVVLAAGRGTRLRPETEQRPKALVRVAGRPLLSHAFEALLSAGVTELVVVVGYRGRDVVDYYGDAYRGVPITYARQLVQRGTAHALLAAERYVADDFALVYGDNVYDADLAAVVDRHREAGADATALMDSVSPAAAGRAGVFEVEDGEVVGLVEKPETAPSTTVPRGFYAFSPRIFDACRVVEPADTGEYELTDAVDLLLHAGAPVSVVEFDGWAINVNTPEDVERAEAYLRE